MSINRSTGLVYTGTARRYTVPDTIETATISYSMSGGSGGGGGNDSHPGGKGGAAGYIRGSFDVVGGDVLEVGVGGGGTAGSSGGNAAGGRSGQSLTGYVGGQGGHSGPGGGSGAGGGGGGASVVKKNNSAVATAAGGGGGGGGGNTGAANGHASPDYPTGAWTPPSYPSTLGQNGADHSGDGGGGGGGGGGELGGQGGLPVSGDVGGNSGKQGYSNGVGVTLKTEVNQPNGGYAGGVVFDSADLARLGAAAGAADHYRSQNSAYGAFLNAHGVWYDEGSYDRTWVVNFPVSGNYLFEAAWDNAGRISVEGVTMIERFTGNDAGTFQNTTEATKYIEAGFRNVNMYAENYGGPGSIGCVITGFAVAASVSARNAGVAGGAGTQPGNSGYIDLSMSAKLKRGVKVKVGGAWVTSEEIYVKLNGTWKRSTQVWAKVNGVWKAAFIRTDDSSITFNFSSTSSGWGDGAGNYASGGASGGSSSGGGGGGCKIICTKLHELGYLPDHIYAADEKFGEWLRENDPYAYYGYVKWASVVVDWMDKDGPQCMFWIRDKQKRNDTQRAMAISWARKIATPWAQHMAFLMGVEKEDNKAGRLIMKTGMWVSRMIGKYTKTTEPTKSPVLGYVMWATFGVFWLLAGVK
jgi:hypothetical protein